MMITIVTPAPPGSRRGNRITAERWAHILGRLGHEIRLLEEFDGQACGGLIALHARKSAASIVRFRNQFPDRPLIVALTGTDLYGGIDSELERSLELANRTIVLQACGVSDLPPAFRDRARVIHQSVERPRGFFKPRVDAFEVAVVGHLRSVKDPFRTAEASRLLPGHSRLIVLHLGGALTPEMEERARREDRANPRYRWLGELPRDEMLRTLARCRLLALSSVLEGGANAVGEAIALEVPVVSTRISGSIGLLGADYPGYFPVGDTPALADLLWRCESDEKFYDELRQKCRKRSPLFEPEQEVKAWEELLASLGVERGD